MRNGRISESLKTMLQLINLFIYYTMQKQKVFPLKAECKNKSNNITQHQKERKINFEKRLK